MAQPSQPFGPPVQPVDRLPKPVVGPTGGRTFANEDDRQEYELGRLGRCARSAWEYGVDAWKKSERPRAGVTSGHILLGTLYEEGCAGGLILGKMGLDIPLAYKHTEWFLYYSKRQPEPSTEEWGGVAHTANGRRVMDLTIEEADLYYDTFPIGTEHLVIALLRIPGSLGCAILNYFGIFHHDARAARDTHWDVSACGE
jgi:hypothetical protein